MVDSINADFAEWLVSGDEVENAHQNNLSLIATTPKRSQGSHEHKLICDIIIQNHSVICTWTV